MKRLLDQKAIVTGGGSGIGRATAMRLAAEGAHILVADIRASDAEETASLIQHAGGTALSIACDVRDEEQVANMTQSAIDSLGGLDILVANAGVVTPGRIHELSLQDWQRVIDVNLTGCFLCIREALRYMVQNKGGNIVTVGSVSSVVIGGGGSAASYKASKGGLLQLTRAVAVEYAHQNIRANCVCPGLVTTKIMQHAAEESEEWTSQLTESARQYSIDTPIEDIPAPEDIAGVIAFLLSKDAAFMTGSAVMVDGGYTAI